MDSRTVTNGWIDKLAVKKIALWTAVYLGIIWGLAPLLDRPVVQPIHNAWVLNGHGLASFPMWGYSLLIRLFGSVSMVVALQSVVGALASSALMVRLIYLAPRRKLILTLLFLSALPWLSYMAYAYQMPMSSAFMVLALLVLEQAICKGNVAWGMLAGVIFAMGQNFRSELILLPTVILIILFIFQKRRWLEIGSLKPTAVCVGVALMLQVPWAMHCRLHGGRFSLSESNLGHVAFVGLGNLSSNPWKIIPSDGFAQETVDQAGLSCSSLSFEGSDYLLRKSIALATQNPGAYLKCVAARVRATVFSPFAYVGFPAAADRAARDIARKISPALCCASIKDDDLQAGNAQVSQAQVVCALSYMFGQRLLANAVSLLGILGFLLAIGEAPFSLKQPLVLCLAAVCFYRIGINVALCEGSKYMTGVYLCYLPFVANSMDWLCRRAGFPRK